MSVVAFARKPDEPTVGQCPACGGENGQHKHLSIPYPWPLQLAVFKVVPCPVASGDFNVQE